ncbi:DUF1800 family protein [Oxalobacteraceae bacterium]|nr:DUF1800 family protein [Oxalobacteraceae bacterium]
MNIGRPTRVVAALALAGICASPQSQAAEPAPQSAASICLPGQSYGNMTAKEASRFLTQASFGSSFKTMDELCRKGSHAWITEQFAKPQNLHLPFMMERDRQLKAIDSASKADQPQWFESFWRHAIGDLRITGDLNIGDDQLRQRVAFALSKIFVISYANGADANFPYGMAHFYDLLGQYGFGNFRSRPRR